MWFFTYGMTDPTVSDEAREEERGVQLGTVAPLFITVR
jgi:hypothetical protein